MSSKAKELSHIHCGSSEKSYPVSAKLMLAATRVFSNAMTNYSSVFCMARPVDRRHPNCTLEQMLEYYESDKNQDQYSPETKLIKLDITVQEHADMVALLRALNGKELLHIFVPILFLKVEFFTAVSFARN